MPLDQRLHGLLGLLEKKEIDDDGDDFEQKQKTCHRDDISETTHKFDDRLHTRCFGAVLDWLANVGSKKTVDASCLMALAERTKIDRNGSSYLSLTGNQPRIGL